MPKCLRCHEVKPMDDFSDAQLLSGRGKCLQCSNPRLHARRCDAGLSDWPLSDLGRSRPRAPKHVNGGLRECMGCHQQLPLKKYSARQLSGKGKCHACASQSSALNEAQQAKRKRDDIGFFLMGTSEGVDSEDEYVRELLHGVEVARNARKSSVQPEPVLDESNPGHRMLQRLGWTPGSGLGARSDGAIMPAAVTLLTQQDKRGLGQVDHGISGESSHVPSETNHSCVGTARPIPVDELVWSAEPSNVGDDSTIDG